MRRSSSIPTRPLAAAWSNSCPEDPVSRTPVEDTAFAQIADLYQYDADLPLEGVTVGSWPARIPYVIDKVIFTSTHFCAVCG